MKTKVSRFIKHKVVGTCGACGSEELTYEAVELCGTFVYFPFICKCGATGKEYFNLEYTDTETEAQ